MRKFYLFAFSLISILSFSQSTISFESSEGFTAGSIHGQGTWVTTGTGGTPANVANQIINSEDKTAGLNSLKITKESAFSGQSSTIVGAFDNLAATLPYNNFTISFDIKITEKSSTSSDFAFATVNTTAGSYVTWLRCQFDGKIMVATTAWNDSGATWNANTWYRFKVVGGATSVSYYLNNTLIYTGAPMTTNAINQLRFVHDNYSGSAYVDNIRINNEITLGTDEISAKENNISIYPNPTTEFVNIKSSKKIKNVEVFDISGRKINVKLDGDRVDVRSLSAGSYLLNVETEGKNITEKFIKK
ncbi:T9SS type A sorting domain-containing protein [Chryseobacterium sp. MMS23-Vi53]|uniref:T9SS type A sorting domain-containing protein n=1 Tax=Chryseobacterium sp. MMS23-Vi53 TaxID=3386644 RepID=UPI0039E9B47B